MKPFVQCYPKRAIHFSSMNNRTFAIMISLLSQFYRKTFTAVSFSAGCRSGYRHQKQYNQGVIPIAVLLLAIMSLFTGTANAQNDTIPKTDSTPKPLIRAYDATKAREYPFSKKRARLVAIGNVAGYGAAMAGLYAAWYSKYPQSSFHVFNDNAEWLQVDKVGHIYSAYIESYGSMEMWRWTGVSRKKRIWLGGLSGAAYQTVIETLDGFSKEWGWSWGDFAANIIGSGALIAQELAWDEQRIRMKFSFHRKGYGDPMLNRRAEVLFGKKETERFLKDYNGQTYWLSLNLKSFFKQSKLPPWLNIAVGYGAEGMFGGTENIARDDNGNITFNRTDIKRYRQWYLAPDIDLTRIKTNKKALRFIFGVLNIVKFPTPSLEFSNGKFRVNAITF
jgi:uncharacterized protein YfiM (DUF2279 family)